MRNAVPPYRQRYRRLLILCACSAAVHVALLDWIAARADLPAAAALPPRPPDLSVRLLRPGARNGAAPAAHAVARVPSQRTAGGAVAPLPEPGRAGAAHVARPAAPAAMAPVPDAAPSHDVAPSPTLPGTPLLPMPGRYRVRLPAPALLTYAVARQAPGAAPQPVGDARLDWRIEGGRYALEVDGVLGQLRSDGVNGDTGMVPDSAREERDGGAAVTAFDAVRHRVRFADGSDAPLPLGMQDRASLLIQLAGIGLADPAQFANGVRVAVAGAHEARIAAFYLLGEEEVETGIGTLATWHLARQAGPGEPALEIWLAPARDWLPVRMRVVDAGGASLTQTLRAAAPTTARPDAPAP